MRADFMKNADAKSMIKIVGVLILCSFLFSFFIGFVYFVISGAPLSEIFGYRPWKFVILAVVLFFVFLTQEMFIFTHRHDLAHNNKHLGVILFCTLVGISFSVIFGTLISPFCIPLMAVGILESTLLDKRLALLANSTIQPAFLLFAVILRMSDNNFLFVLAAISQVIAGSILIIYTKKAFTRIMLVSKSITIGIFAVMPLAILLSLLDSTNGAAAAMNALWALFAVVIAVAIFMVALPILESIFSLYSDFRLEEICSPNHRLMKELAIKAPGTYNHSLVVGNLAQACAVKIGENPALARAAAYYHDIGKVKDPNFFTENQQGDNPHDDLVPEVSVFKILEHASYGAEYIRKNHLPDAIAQIAMEHHGTTPVMFFFNKAKGITEEQLEKEQYSYPGPKPKTKISAIIMICDTVEAATRAQDSDKSPDEFRRSIHALIDSRASTGQFSDCPITYRDLRDIEDALVIAVPLLYHKRIKYTK